MILKEKRPKVKILVVENSPVLGRDLKQSLERMGYFVSGVVKTRKGAIEGIRSIPVDLVLIDIQLKKKTSGINASKDIQSKFDVPVVYLSDVPEERVLQQIRNTTPHGFLLKPYKDAELESEIEIAMSQHKRQSQIKHEEKMFRFALTNTGYAVLLTDKAGNISFVNKACWNLVQPVKKKVLRMPFEMVIRLGDRQKKIHSQDIKDMVLKKGKQVNLNKYRLWVSKLEKWIDINGECAPLVISEQILGMVMIIKSKFNKNS